LLETKERLDFLDLDVKKLPLLTALKLLFLDNLFLPLLFFDELFFRFIFLELRLDL